MCFFCFFLCAYTIFDRSSPKCSLRKFLGEVLSGHATHILHCFNSMRQLGDELERTENNTGRVKEYIRLSSYCIWIFSFVLVCVKAVTCSKCPCVHFVSSTPSAEYIMCSRPCAFMWRVVLVQYSHLRILLNTPLLSLYKIDEVFASIGTKLSWLLSVLKVL